MINPINNNNAFAVASPGAPKTDVKGKERAVPPPPMPPEIPPEQPPMPPEPDIKGECTQSYPLSVYDIKRYQEIVNKAEGGSITFLVENGGLYTSTAFRDKLSKIAELVSQLNAYVHDKPVLRIRIVDTLGHRGEFTPGGEGIVISSSVLNEEDCLYTIAHEMGHAIYCSMPKDKEFWQKIYLYSLGNRRYGLVTDSRFTLNSGYYGHPFRNPAELFASSFAAYVMRPNEMICTDDPGILNDSRLMGKILFCYIRDKVVEGKIFGAEDPFKSCDAEKLINSITEEDIYGSIQSALHDSTCDFRNTSVSEMAANELFSRARKNERYSKLLAASAFDKDPVMRRAVIVAICRSSLRDAKMDQILLSALHDSDPYIRALVEGELLKRKINFQKPAFQEF